MSDDSPAIHGKFFFPYGDINNITGDLPNWRQDGVMYFITFRLADSLPEEKLAQWRHERDAWLAKHPRKLSITEEEDYHEKFTARMETWLDAGSGSCLLRRLECREIVEGALRHFDGERYRLGEQVVAANHVHVVVTPLTGYALSDILHSWKSFTAKELLKVAEASRLLSATSEPEAGRLRHSIWQRESYDHIIRSPEALWHIGQYIRGHSEWRRPPAQSGGGVPPPAR